MQHTSLLLHFNLNLTCFSIDYRHALSLTLEYSHIQHAHQDIFITFMSLFNNQHIKNDRNENYLLKSLEINLKSPTTTTTTMELCWSFKRQKFYTKTTSKP